MAITLTDVRCGCGGLCDSAELCPMRGNVEACPCGSRPIHSPSQHSKVVRPWRACWCGGSDGEHNWDAHAEEGHW